MLKSHNRRRFSTMEYFQSLVPGGFTYNIFNIISSQISMFIFTTEKFKVLKLGESDHMLENNIKWLKNSLAEKGFSVTVGTKILVSPKCAFHCRFSV